ncbi:amiloride-sensitive sodium channel subunit alpha [Plakobranchus ocellatus]|uniref:Amiloride-sensitive sodium channel subunit alpha n=1 Tax=Plakobranchus ocellatus TaxID=259542 RepID=A0AAV3Y6H8_9GAST|nr:amiloride-sensitive sodium channel subunit alpha [Plakobranchus ocellatus]
MAGSLSIVPPTPCGATRQPLARCLMFGQVNANFECQSQLLPPNFILELAVVQEANLPKKKKSDLIVVTHYKESAATADSLTMANHVYYIGAKGFGTSDPNKYQAHSADHPMGQFGQYPTSQFTQWPKQESSDAEKVSRNNKDNHHKSIERVHHRNRSTASSYRNSGQLQVTSLWETDSIPEDDRSYSIGRIFSKFADKCSMNGVPYIKQSQNYVVKTVWSVLLILAVGAMSYHLYRLFSIFVEFKKQTQVQLSFSSLQFPAVTICNVNHMRMSQRHLASYELNEFIDNIHPDVLTEKLMFWEPSFDDTAPYLEDFDFEEDFPFDQTEEKRRKKRQTNTDR